jgi:hypothetical protein
MELTSRVPKDRQKAIEAELKPAMDIFSEEYPTTGRWAVHLREIMTARGEKAEALAQAIDTDPDHVRTWMEMDNRDTKRGRVASATQSAIAKHLRVSEAELFADTRPDAQFQILDPTVYRIAANACYSQIQNNDEIDAALAKELDLSPELVQRWVEGKEAVAPQTAAALKSHLGQYTGGENLFRNGQ